MSDDSSARSWKDAVRQLGDRLRRDYESRVWPFARGLDFSGNSTVVELGIALGGRVGPMTGFQIRYAKRTGPLGLFGPRVILKDFGTVERELRQAIENWLAEQESRNL